MGKPMIILIRTTHSYWKSMQKKKNILFLLKKKKKKHCFPFGILDDVFEHKGVYFSRKVKKAQVHIDTDATARRYCIYFTVISLEITIPSHPFTRN